MGTVSLTSKARSKNLIGSGILFVVEVHLSPFTSPTPLGSGKTIAFLLPLLEHLISTQPKIGSAAIGSNSSNSGVRGLILSPTRELSQQTLRVLRKLIGNDNPNAADDSGGGGCSYRFRCVGIHGAESMEKQFDLLSSKPDVIVATPGRLAHHLTEIPDFTLDQCRMCILDESDRLLEMGFASQIRQIARSLPEHACQKVLLSATMPKVLVEFTKSGFAVDPAIVRLDSEATVSDQLRIAFVTCRSGLDKDAALLHILQHIREQQKSPQSKKEQQKSSSSTGLTLIFAATRHHVEYLATLINASFTGNSSTAPPIATTIYGTLDQEARKRNLSAFRAGHTPVLVVTDVAARGIDVPLIDHVVHYHFPASPKLFVHRSGRAARAGRVGYCWGLVEPDELPYMMDLYLFLGRKPTAVEDRSASYTLQEMTPDMVHYGSLPELVVAAEVENVQRLLNSELSSSQEADSLRALTKVCKNAMKQYRKTRTEASREGVRRAKAILEGERMETGQRVGGGALPPHPLLRGMELQWRQNNGTAAAGTALVDEREDFLRAMSAFRPKETVFEAFATGKSKEAGVVSHLDRGRTSQKAKGKDNSTAALAAMKDMRRQMRMARDKGSTLVVAGSTSVAKTNGKDDANGGPDDDSDRDVDHHDEDSGMDDGAASFSVLPTTRKLVPALPSEGKRRLSKAERRRLKKNPYQSSTTSAAAGTPSSKKVKRDFRDPSYFIDNDFSSNSEEAQRSRMIEASMQPSASSKVGTALRIEETMLDLVGDENDDLIRKQRMMRWDKSKRKYVATTVGEELKGESKTKKLRLESGQLVKGDKLKLGELYQKWQKKTNRSIGRTGVFDDDDTPADAGGSSSRKRKGGKKTKGGGMDKEMKSPAEIKREREKKQNMKLKNMKKGDRRHMEQKLRNSGAQGGTNNKGKGSKKR